MSEPRLITPADRIAALEQIYQWLNDGNMSDWGKRCHYHEMLGKMLSKPPVAYGE